MKKKINLLALISLLVLSNSIFGQDTLFMRNGDTIPCTIIGESNKKITIILPGRAEESRVEKFDVYDYTYSNVEGGNGGFPGVLPKASKWEKGLAGLRFFGPGYGVGGEFFFKGSIISSGLDISFGSVLYRLTSERYLNGHYYTPSQIELEDRHGRGTSVYGFYFEDGTTSSRNFSMSFEPIFRFKPEVNCYLLPPSCAVRPYVSMNTGFALIQYYQAHLELAYDLQEDASQHPYLVNYYDYYRYSVNISQHSSMALTFGGSLGVAFKFGEHVAGKIGFDASLFSYSRYQNSYEIKRKDGQTDRRDRESIRANHPAFFIPVGISYSF